MTSAYDRNDVLVTAQEKLEWVTPQISLMGAGNTEGKNPDPIETFPAPTGDSGPS